jgi:two-component system, chemotaxis family, protein-glutamate methylesterase/glutaminase
VQHPLTVLVVDDAATFRKILSDVVDTIPDTRLLGTAPNGKVALSKLAQSSVDVVLMDIEMPVMEGMETLRIIRDAYPDTEVIIISGTTKGNADVVIEALEAGALDFIAKSQNGNLEANANSLREQLVPLFKTTRSKHNLRHGNIPEENKDAQNRDSKKHGQQPHPTVDLIAIAVSTGGPTALHEIIPKLPEDLGVPILVIQHMPAVFTGSFAKSLNTTSKLQVKEAEDGESVLENTVYIAPGGQHMVVQRDAAAITQSPLGIRIGLNEDPPENSCRPSADVLFRSLANIYGKNVLTLILTGMGCDGAQGTQALKEAGGYCITQSEQSCIVYGMPRAVTDMGLADEAIDLAEIADRIISLVKKQ